MSALHVHFANQTILRKVSICLHSSDTCRRRTFTRFLYIVAPIYTCQPSLLQLALSSSSLRPPSYEVTAHKIYTITHTSASPCEIWRLRYKWVSERVKSNLAVGCEKVKLEWVKQYCWQPSLSAFDRFFLFAVKEEN